MQSHVVLRTRRLGAVLIVCLLAACDSDSPTAPGQTPPPPANVPFSTLDLTPGTGPAATIGQILSVAFTGWLFDTTATDNKGAVFDQSTVFNFVLGEPRFIEGWNMGIEGMRDGGLRRIIIPPDLGFGSQGVPGAIPPNATVIFEVEVLSITPVEPFSVTDLVVGTGDPVGTSDTVTIDFAGWVFDENAADNKGRLLEEEDGFTVALGNPLLFDGLTRGIEGMRAGGSRRIVIPPLDAFGSVGNSLVPPFATLLYEVDLVSVQ